MLLDLVRGLLRRGLEVRILGLGGGGVGFQQRLLVVLDGAVHELAVELGAGLALEHLGLGDVLEGGLVGQRHVLHLGEPLQVLEHPGVIVRQLLAELLDLGSLRLAGGQLAGFDLVQVGLRQLLQRGGVVVVHLLGESGRHAQQRAESECREGKEGTHDGLLLGGG